LAPSPSTITHWDGTAWKTALTSPANLTAVWGGDANDVWAAGTPRIGIGDFVFDHWDGHAWKEVTTHVDLPPSNIPIEVHVTALWGRSSTDVWAATDAGFFIHWNGSAWSAVPTGVNYGFSRLWGSADGFVAVGEGISAPEGVGNMQSMGVLCHP
jgi:hypothetical protein